MKFTFSSYKALIGLIRSSGYEIADYHDWEQKPRCVILRHDIDLDLPKAVAMAGFEKELGVKSTFFVLLTSELYNVFSKTGADCLKKIADCGHEIGLHFDEVRYPEAEGDLDAVRERITEESRLLGQAAGMKITTVSMHRPSRMMLEADLKIPGIINSYGSVFFKDFKYLSDSRRRWREPAEEIIASKQYDRLQILTHAFWYEEKELDLHDSVAGFVNGGSLSRYRILKDNITDLGSIMDMSEVK